MAPGRGRAAALAGLVLGVLGLAAAAGAETGSAAAVADRSDRDWLHVRATLFGDSAGDSRRVARWRAAPTLALFGARAADRALVAGLVADANRVLAGGRIRIEAPRPRSTAGIGLYFVPRAEARRVALSLGLNEGLAARGAGWTGARLGPAHGLRSAVAVIRDELAGDERRATVAHELYHALGPGGHSPRFPASVVYRRGDATSTASAFAPIDLKTLGLLYRHLEPGDDEAAARAAFDSHWAGLDALLAE